MKTLCIILALFCVVGLALAQAPTETKPAESPANDISGMYSFLREGEYLQITVEDQGKVTGVLSRFGDLDSDRGAFLDQFLDQGTLKDGKLQFSTRPLHGVRFEFKGAVERGKGKLPGEEAYYVLRGTLTQYVTDATKKSSAKAREVEFKSFPSDLNVTKNKRD